MKHHGFTLIEVVAVVGLLALMGILSVTGAVPRWQVSQEEQFVNLTIATWRNMRNLAESRGGAAVMTVNSREVIFDLSLMNQFSHRVMIPPHLTFKEKARTVTYTRISGLLASKGGTFTFVRPDGSQLVMTVQIKWGELRRKI